jgi:hypothetical protein
LIGAFAGLGKWKIMVLTAFITLMFSRLSAELYYRLLVETQNERLRILYDKLKGHN